jgi:hypothetical protein
MPASEAIVTLSPVSSEMAMTRRRQGDRGLLGAILLLVGAGWLLGDLHLLHLGAQTLLSVLLIVVGLGVLANPRSRRKWPLVLGAAITFVLATSTVHVQLPSARGTGMRIERPVFASALQPSYHLGMGNLTLDLTAVSLPAGERSLDASIGVGDLVVIVPDGVAISVHAQDGTGAVTVMGTTLGSGVGINQGWRSSDFDRSSTRLDLNLHVGVGDIVVRSGPPAAPAAPVAPKTPAALLPKLGSAGAGGSGAVGAG